jgi:NAD(P)-dependent dehydrogenase (short-subunit alcohol dehydrogenase family)
VSLDVSKSVAVITGAGSGIGRATAEALAGRGGRVLVTDIDGERAEHVAAAIGSTAAAAQCDVTSLTDVEAARDLALDRFGRIDIVMSNAGVLAVGPVESIPLDAWERVIDVNLMGAVRCNLVFLPILLAQGSGHLVYTSSTSGMLPYFTDSLPYTATKHALVGIAESLALYLHPKGIGVTCLCPAGVATNLAEQITFYGEMGVPSGPDLPVVDAAIVGELAADAITEGRFLVLTAPEVADELRERAADIEAYLARQHAPRP